MFPAISAALLLTATLAHSAPEVLQISEVAGNERVHDFVPWYFCEEAVAFRNDIYFSAGTYSDKRDNGKGDVYGPQHVWKWDGRESKQFSNTSGRNDLPIWLSPGPRHLFFYALNPERAWKLYASDGITVKQVSNTSGDASKPDVKDPSPCSNDRERGIVIGDRFVFSALNAHGARKLYASDGETSWQISNTRENETQDDAPDFHEWSWGLKEEAPRTSGHAVFVALNKAGVKKLYVTDGHTVSALGDMNGDPAKSDEPAAVAPLGEAFIVTARNSADAQKVYKVEGTKISQIADGKAETESVYFWHRHYDYLTVSQGKIYFWVEEAKNERVLYSVDAHHVGKVPMHTRLSFRSATYLKAAGGNIYFSARPEASSSIEKWYHLSDAGELSLLTTADSSDYASAFQGAQSFNGKLYFVGEKESFQARRLYEADGTAVKEVAGNYREPFLWSSLGDFAGASFFMGFTERRLYTLDSAGKVTQLHGIDHTPIITGGRVVWRGPNAAGYQKLFEVRGL
jgi:hypothetical protein